MQDVEKRKLRHDVGGCLNSIQLCVEVLESTESREEAATFHDCIRRETAKIEAMMNALVRRPGTDTSESRVA